MSTEAQEFLAPELFDVALSVAARVAAAHEDEPEAFLAWGRFALAGLLDLDVLFDADDAERVAYWLGRAIWDAMPLESRGFQPHPLPVPSPMGSCPCGSGEPHQRCCRPILQQAGVPSLPTAAMWEPWVAARTDRHLLEIAATGSMPLQSTIHAVYALAMAERWRVVRKLAERWLAAGTPLKDAALAELIDPLCDALDATLSTDRNKAALLKRLAVAPLAAVRGAANRRLAAWLNDRGDSEGSLQALQAAQQAEPGHPETALLELTILAAHREHALLRERARFWRRQLRGADVSDELMAFLDDAVRAPEALGPDLWRHALNEPAARLADWAEAARDRPLPPGGAWLPMPGAFEGDALISNAWIRGEQPLDAQWAALRPTMQAPGTTADDAPADGAAWNQAHAWLDWLESHPQAADSFTVLDDLTRMLDELQDSDTAESTWHWAGLLAERGARLLAADWPAHRHGQLPWLVIENRPPLRLLVRALEHDEFDLDQPAARARIELYLRLNPHDNHGLRAPLMNWLLQQGAWEAALALAARYPDDAMMEISYGRVLALFALDQRSDARAQLLHAATTAPLVLDYLVRDRLRRPRQAADALAMDDAHRAWHYRATMRATWRAQPDLAAWLAETATDLRRQR